MTKFSLEIEFPEGKTREDMCHRARAIMRYIVGCGRYNINWHDGGKVRDLDNIDVAKIIWTES